ncbi:DUF2057 family protein, partial [Pseudomonas sp. SIMBA_021]
MHEVVESEPFWVDITIEAGTDYTLVFNRAENAVAAKVFAQSPMVSLKAKGSALAAPLSVVSNNQLASEAPVRTMREAPAGPE